GVSSAGVGAAVTTMVSVRLGGIAASSLVVCDRRSTVWMRTHAKPSWVNLTRYSPGGSDAKSYAPESPVIATRVPCSAGEEIVTVTPASGRPPAVTVPVSDADVCPYMADASASDIATAASLDGNM